MYERMLNKKITPTIDEMISYCEECGELFSNLNDWLTTTFETEQTIVFPYGNSYGWGVAHKKKKKLICNIFAEKDALTVMLRLSDQEYKKVYEQLHEYAKTYVDHKYPCGDGGWIHYRVTSREHMEDIQKLLSVKCAG